MILHFFVSSLVHVFANTGNLLIRVKINNDDDNYNNNIIHYLIIN
jgi:hypothetical protein